MRKPNNFLIICLCSMSMLSCISTSQLQTAKDETQRLSQLLEKERSENDQLNAQRSIYESQIQSLQANNNKQIAETAATIESLKQQIAKLSADNARKDESIKSLEQKLKQEKEAYSSTVAALDEKIDDLADDKRELQHEKYELRKEVAKKKSTKKRRRRR